MDPLIFHVDMDAFFVSVEELFHPELKGKPVVVGGDPSHRGVVAAASYAARKFGIHSAMPLATAKSLCPQAIFLPGRHKAYSEYSGQVFQVFSTFTPVVEPVSIDEAYLDFTGSSRMHGNPFGLAHRLRGAILEKTRLSASIGISRTRLVSKVASDLAKPAGILRVMPGREAFFLSPLPVGKIPGVGKVTEDHLNQLGILTVGDLARTGLDFLAGRFGKWGEALYRKSQGEETAHFEYHEEPKSISHETTFDQDLDDTDPLEKTLVWLVQKVCHRLREHGMYAATVTLKLRDWRFRTITRARTLAEPTQLDKPVLETVLDLFRQNWPQKRKIRLLGVALSGLSYTPVQAALFEAGQQEKLGRLYQAADQVRDKWGFQAITSARTLR
jgi:DNA polymerase-4